MSLQITTASSRVFVASAMLLGLLLASVCTANELDDISELTEAQKAAVDLAATLATDTRPDTVPAGTALVPLSAARLTQGRRFQLVLYASEAVEVRAVSGRPTLLSPVDDIEVVSSDGRRPVMTHGTDGAMAIEALFFE